MTNKRKYAIIITEKQKGSILMRIVFAIMIIVSWVFSGVIGVTVARLKENGDPAFEGKFNGWFLAFILGIFFIEPIILWCLG